jgi:hypothetical protein
MPGPKARSPRQKSILCHQGRIPGCLDNRRQTSYRFGRTPARAAGPGPWQTCSCSRLEQFYRLCHLRDPRRTSCRLNRTPNLPAEQNRSQTWHSYPLTVIGGEGCAQTRRSAHLAGPARRQRAILLRCSGGTRIPTSIVIQKKRLRESSRADPSAIVTFAPTRGTGHAQNISQLGNFQGIFFDAAFIDPACVKA